MSAPTTEYDFEKLLKGLRGNSRTNGTMPDSTWTHLVTYIFAAAGAFIAALVLVFIILLENEIRHLNLHPDQRQYSGERFWVSVLVIFAPLLLVIVCVAWRRISPVIYLRDRFNCSYQDAYYVFNTPLLRSLALTLTDEAQMHAMLAEARLIKHMHAHRAFICSVEEQLRDREGQLVADLRTFLVVQKSWIDTRL